MLSQLKTSFMCDALREWTAALGPEFVIRDRQALRAAETATFETDQKIPVILRPKDRDELREILAIANAAGAPVYPISSGKNWGYGSRVPTETGCALLDLSRMNRILDFNEKLGYVTVEPGVTQRMLFQCLRERKSNLWMDATGSSPDCSLIGNAMERGFGHTPYGDHFANVCGLEVMLPDGSLIETGFAGLPGARTGPLYRWGMGPSLDGLFSQSNFGIITRLSIWLMPAPEYFQSFFFQCDGESSLAPLIDALRPLRLNGALRSAVHIGNDYKVMGGIQQFPAGEEMPITPERMRHYRAALKFGRWSGSGALYGTRGQVAESRRLLRQALKGKVNKIQFLDERTLQFATRFTRPYKMITGLDLTRTLELARPVFDLLKGIPTDKPLGSAYWRKTMPVPADPNPDRDACGLLWCAPVAPLDGSEAARLVEMTERTLLQGGYEPMISLTLLTERSLASVISITYDRSIPGEDSKAMACYRTLEERLNEAGFYPYRLGIESMNIQNRRGAYTDLLGKIKTAVDPNGILAPGRYMPARLTERSFA